MELFIDTTNPDFLLLALRGQIKPLVKKVKTNKNQSEKLWPALEALLKQTKTKPTDIKKIVVANGRGGFTALRIGIAAANALAYAWGIPVEDENGQFKRAGGLKIVEPRYTSEAKIG